MASTNSGLGGPAGFGEGVFSTARKSLGDNDDGAVTVDVTPVFGTAGLKFFEKSYTELHINSNGVISFGSPDTAYSGSNLSDLSQPSIAPFWADHNIGGGGEIYWDVDPSSGKVTITWNGVASYSGSGANTYQVVLQDKGNGSLDVEFIYEDIEWFQSNGTSAVAGITDGGSAHFPLDGSGSPNELKQYDSNNFGGGDTDGTYKVPFVDGMPQFQNDVVEGTSGNDTFIEASSDLHGDVITSGADSVMAGAGDDLIDAGKGDDTVHGGSGSDSIQGGAGADEIYGDGVLGDAAPAKTTINTSNFSDTSSGFKVSARNVENGTLSNATTDNISSAMGGFGASGAVSDSDSGVFEQTGFDLASGLSEQLIVDFDAPIEDASFSFIALYTASYGEQAQWAIYDDGKIVAKSTFTEDGSGSGNGTIDLSGNGPFDQIVFTGLPQTDRTDGSDFFITEITFANPASASGHDDSIKGGDGGDAIFGGLGHDKISGDEGNDFVSGGAGDDSISGGLGDDYIEGGEGNDSLSTGLGEDTLMGGAGDDTLRNSDGDDSLDGGSGDDLIVATGGEDTLRGGSGSDKMEGGNDADTFIIEDGFGNDSITGGEGTTDVTDTDFDTIDLSAITTGPVKVYYTDSEAGTITDGADTITFTEIERIILTGDDDHLDGGSDKVGMNIEAGAGNDTVIGGNGADTLSGGSGDDWLRGLGGDDSIDGGDGNDSINGEDGADSIWGAAGSDTIWGDAGNDKVDGGAGDDEVAGGTGDDTVSGGTGSDTLRGDGGNDSLSGDDDADTFIFADAFGNDTILGGEGGKDEDTIDLSTLSGPVTVSYSGDEAGTITDGTDTIVFTEIENLILTDKADLVYGQKDSAGLNIDAGDGNDTITDGDGNDSIQGGSGDDYVAGNLGNDTIEGGDGNDDIEGGKGADSIDGGAGDDFLAGYDVAGLASHSTVANTDDGSDDTLVGGAGQDTLLGGDGSDSLDGGAGNDSIDGGDGADIIFFGDGDNTVNAGAGNDYVDDESGNPGYSGNNKIDLGDGNDIAFTGYGNDTVEGGSGDDTINSQWGNDSISGGDGNDQIQNEFDDSTLDGGAGNDTILGGANGDTITGGTGNDSLTGGDGNDVFVYTLGDGSDTITDFNFGNTGTLDDGDSTNNDFIDLSKYYDNLSELYADHADDGTLNQSNTFSSNGQATDYSDNDQFAPGEGITFQGASADKTSFTAENTAVVCFTTGTAIQTPRGNVLIDNLCVGDLVSTLDNGAQPIRWIGKTHLGPDALTCSPHCRPILIKREVMGNTRDLLVSPQHGMLLGGDHLVRAKHLAEATSGIRVAHGKRHVTYVHLMLENHQILFAENTPTESFYPGPMAMRTLSARSCRTLLRALPQLPVVPSGCRPLPHYGPAARPFMSKHKVRKRFEFLRDRCVFA